MVIIRSIPPHVAATAFALTLIASTAVAGDAAAADRNLAPYVPSPPEIVGRMLELAEVGPDDLVYDLGCGDGRIVIAAAKRHGARGLGIDLDPERIAESVAAAAREGVAGKVEFRVGDVLQADVAPATVVALYLLPDGLARLEAVLRGLRPGSRIISHNYPLAGWRTARMDRQKDGRGWDHVIYLYRIEDRSEATGTWTWAEGRARWSARFIQDGGELQGLLRGPGWEKSFSGGTVEGDRISFRASIPLQAGEVPTLFQGTWDGDWIRGSIAIDGDPGSKRPWVPRREIPRPMGTWEWTEETPSGPARTSLEIRRQGWTTSARYGRGPVSKIEVRGARLAFEADATVRTVHGIRQVRQSYAGIIDGEVIEGTCTSEGTSSPWKAARPPRPAAAPKKREAPAAKAGKEGPEPGKARTTPSEGG